MSHYKKTRGSANMSGELYEVKLSALLFLRALSCQNEFQIASNMEAAGCFDDIVFTMGPETAFIQLKHREKQQTKVYTSQLIQLKGDFSLLKYCKSYFDIKRQWKRDRDLQSRGKFDDCLFIVFTNAGLVGGVGTNANSIEMHNAINAGGKCIRFTEEIDKDIYNIFENLARYKLLLAKAVSSEEVEDTQGLLEIVQKLYNNNAKQIPSKTELTKLLKDLESFGDLSDYREFFSCLRFYTEQNSEKDFNNLITNEVKYIFGTDEVFDRFMIGAQNWWRNTNLYLTRHIRFWQDILVSCGGNICKQVADVGLRFSEAECDAVRNRLLSANRISYLRTRCPQLSSLKLLQSLDTKLVVDVSRLETSMKEVLAVWRLGTANNILLVEGWTECGAVVAGINDILDRYSDKKVISILRVDMDSDEIDMDCEDLFSLSQLDEESQDRVLACSVLFQGLPVKLKDLADRDTLTQVVTADTVLQLLSGDGELTVGLKVSGSDPTYITRSLLRKEYINRTIFTDEDVSLAVSGISVEELERLLPPGEKAQIYQENTSESVQDVRFFIIEGTADFCALCEFKDSIHWIHKKNKHFVWRRSKGDLTSILKYQESNLVSCGALEKVMQLPQQVFLVVGEPGVGKSTEMTHLNELLKKMDPCTWIIRVDLNDHTQHLMHDSSDPIKLLLAAAKILDELGRRLLEHHVNIGGKITLIFDGFDEISPKYSEKVLVILKDLLKRNVKHIWVTSRLLIREDLEKELSSFAFKLHHFTSSDESMFLLKLWRMPDSDVHKLEYFIVKLLEITRRSLNDRLTKLTGVPLHMRMLAEVFAAAALHYCQTGELDLPHKLDLLTLYERFIDRKWEVYYAKINIDVTIVGLAEDYEEIREMFQKKLMNFALVALLSNDELKTLHNSEKILHKNRELVEKFKAGRERTGIVIEVTQDSVLFVHKTFAEYFVALWFSQNFSLNSECFRSLYVRKEFQIMRNFFDRMLAQHYDMHVAVLNQDKNLIRTFLSQERYAVNEKDRGGRTALHLAVANYLDRQNEEDHDVQSIIRILLDHRADCSVEDLVLCWTPLRLAEEIRAWSAVGLLLERRSLTTDLVVIPRNIKDDNFVQKVLQVAAIQGYVNLVEFLLQSGVDVEHKITVDQRNRATMLHIASAHNQFRLVRILVEHEADLEAGDVHMKTPLMWAVECGYIKMAKLLIKLGARVDQRDRVENTAFIYAVLNNKYKVMQVLKQYACEDDIYGKNALHYAAVSGYAGWVECLLDCGIDVDGRNAVDYTPLMLAAMYGRLEFVERLVKHGARVNVTRESGESAILYAAYYGYLEIVNFLHQQGADMTVCDREGNSLLHSAAASGNLECVKFVMGCGLDLSSRNNNHETALLFAAKRGSLKVIDYLMQRGADIDVRKKGGNTVLHEAAVAGKVGCVAYLVDCGLEVDCKNDWNLTPLWVAACSGKLKVVKLLQEQGADLGVLDGNGNTVLHAAASEGHLDVVEWLVKQGLDVTRCNTAGEAAVTETERALSCCLSSQDESRLSAVIDFLRRTEEESL